MRKHDRRANTAPRLGHMKKKESLSFLRRYEELNEIVIRAHEDERDDGEPIGEEETAETKEILRKANSAQGRRPVRVARDAGSYYRSEKQMSTTSFSTRWPPSPISEVGRVEKVVMDVEQMGGVSN